MYGYPYARKRLLLEYVHDHLLDMPGLRRHVGKSHDSKRSFQSINQEVTAIVSLWKKEMWESHNPLGAFRSPAEIAADESCRHLTQGAWAEKDYNLGPKTHLLQQLLDSIHVMRENDRLDNFEEKAFRSNLSTLSEDNYYSSVAAAWSSEQPDIHLAMCTAVGMTWGVSTLLRGDSQQVLAALCLYLLCWPPCVCSATLFMRAVRAALYVFAVAALCVRCSLCWLPCVSPPTIASSPRQWCTTRRSKGHRPALNPLLPTSRQPPPMLACPPRPALTQVWWRCRN